MDLRALDEASVDKMIICQGESFVQVKAIADRIQRNTREILSVKALHVEGERDARWILIDYFNTVVHVFYPQIRAFYNLESLWSDARCKYYDTL